VDEHIIKEILAEFDSKQAVAFFVDALQERNLLSSAVDTQVKSEFGFDVINGKPWEVTKVPQELAKQAAERHAQLLAACEKKREESLNKLRVDPDGLLKLGE
jgi:hypothetical protein